MARPARSLATLDRCGNAVCLDFVNTVHSRTDPDPHEYLQSYADLLRWARDGEVLTRQQYRHLRDISERHPARAGRVLATALELRETLYRLFCDLVRRGKPRAGEVEALNAALERALPHRHLSSRGGQFHWDWRDGDSEPEAVLWPIVVSVSELLVSGEHVRIKECPPPEGCGWLYLDTSKNASRRWCNMRTCGSLVKARRYYRRKKARDPEG